MSWRMRVLGQENPSRDTFNEMWRDGCVVLGRNVCELLRRAGVPVTVLNVVRLIKGIPTAETDPKDERWQQESLCCQCLIAMCGPGELDAATEALCEYFITYLPRMRTGARRMLEESFFGVLEGLTLDQLPFAEEIEKQGGAM